MSTTLKLILAGILVVASLFGERAFELIKTIGVDNTPAVINIVEPSISYKNVVKEIVVVDIEKKDAKQISDFFSELASVVENDPGLIKTTKNFRDFNSLAGGLNFAGQELKDKYPSLGEHIDQSIIDSIGKENSPLSPEKRSDLVECLRAVAWAVHQ
jgi:hypothetical protein